MIAASCVRTGRQFYFHGAAAEVPTESSGGDAVAYDVRLGVRTNVAADYNIRSRGCECWTFWDSNTLAFAGDFGRPAT
jgi:hypothetical protein